MILTSNINVGCYMFDSFAEVFTMWSLSLVKFQVVAIARLRDYNIINVLRIWRSFNIVTYFTTFYRRTKICITNGNSFVFTRSLITCFYHTEQYIGFHYLPRRLVRKVVVIVSLLLRLTLTFESRDCSAALIKAAMTFFLQWLTMTFTPSRKSLPTILFIKEWRNP